MAKVIEISKRFNDRWKTDKPFIEGFDYNHPKYANVTDDIRWMLRMLAAQKLPEVQRAHEKSGVESKAHVEFELRGERLTRFKTWRSINNYSKGIKNEILNFWIPGLFDNNYS